MRKRLRNYPKPFLASVGGTKTPQQKEVSPKPPSVDQTESYLKIKQDVITISLYRRFCAK